MNKIICDDVINGLSQIPDNTVHLIITSPPYNVGIDYDKHFDKMPHSEYCEWMKNIWKECYRVLVDGGRICINIDATTNNTQEGIELVHPLHVEFTNQLRDLNYIYRGEIIWNKFNAPGNGTSWGSYMSPSNPRFRRNTEYVICASKLSPYLKGDPNMIDITKDEFHKWTLTSWDITPETSEKGHPVPFPRELVKRCVKLFSYVGNIVLDPFNGSGTTTSVALYYGREYIGIDNSETYCKIAQNHINKIKAERNLFPYQFIPAKSVIKIKHKPSIINGL